MKKGQIITAYIIIALVVAGVAQADLLWSEDFEDGSLTDTFVTTDVNESSCYIAQQGNGFDSLAITGDDNRFDGLAMRFDACQYSSDPLTGKVGCNNPRFFFGNFSTASDYGTNHDLVNSVSATDQLYVKYWARWEPDNDPVNNFMEQKFLAVDTYPGLWGYTVFEYNPASMMGSPMSAFYYNFFSKYTSPSVADVYVRDGNWHKMEFFVDYGAGIIRSWIDDQLVIDWTGVSHSGRPNYLKNWHFNNNTNYCTNSIIQIDDFEVWNSMPTVNTCSDGPIITACECGGSTRSNGYCLGGEVWSDTSMPSCNPSGAEQCTNGVDDDCDGYTDSADIECPDSNAACEYAHINITASDNYILYFNGEYIGQDEDISSIETYTVPLKVGENVIAVNAFDNNNQIAYFAAEIEYCGNTLISNTDWTVTQTKPYGWKDIGYDDSSWANAALNAGSLPSGFQHSPFAIQTIYTPDQADWEIGWFRQEFNIGSATRYYFDGDGDDYGNASVSQVAENPPLNYVLDNTDCNDNNGNINPGEAEICSNSIDEDCSGLDLACGICSNGAITQRCSCEGSIYDAGAGYCCGNSFQTDPCPADVDLVLWFDGESNPTGSITDSSSYGNDGSCSNCPSQVSGYSGQGYDFDGANDMITIADDVSLDLDQATVMAWINVDQYLEDGRIISKEVAGQANPYSIYSLLLSGNNYDQVQFRIGVGSTRYIAESSSTVDLDTWVHVAGSYDGNQVQTYINGVADGSPVSISGAIIDNNEVVSIGGSIPYSPRFIDGTIDEMRVYSRALSASEIQGIMAETAPCVITQNAWNGDTSVQYVDEGTSVTLVTTGTNCDGLTVQHTLYEVDSGSGPDSVTLSAAPQDAVFVGNTATSTWVTEWIEDTDGPDSDPEYIYVSTIASDPSITLTMPDTSRLTVQEVAIPCTDNDGDGWAAESSGCSLGSLSGYGDCNDVQGSGENIHPGATELCNSIDDDCDAGTSDGSGEGWFGDPTSCGVGECSSTGTYICSSGSQVDTCSAGSPEAEVCDGLDNDCDGTVDSFSEACGSGVCTGTRTCTSNSWSECSTSGNDAGVCAICSASGSISYDASQDNDCNANDISGLLQCDYNPDNIDTTLDVYSGFDSSCTGINSCSQNLNWQDDITHSCNINTCGAECETNNDCQTQCVGDNYYSAGSCTNQCSCSYTITACSDSDGWYDTGATRWVSSGSCTEQQEKEQNYRDYSCAVGGCTYSVTDNQWVSTGATRNKADGTSCNDGLFCTANDQCTSGVCTSQSSTDCSSNDVLIDTCTNHPDGIDFTLDEYSFTSSCDETNDLCTQAPGNWQDLISHSCNINTCTAECESDADCDDGNPLTADSCSAGCSCQNTPIGDCIDDSECDDGLWCNGAETCGTGGICQAGTPVVCSGNNININTCTNTPDDGNDYTLDTYTFTSSCNEIIDQCTQAPPGYDVLNSCDIDTCGAECEANTDCTNYCDGTTYFSSGNCDSACGCTYDQQDCNQLDGWVASGTTRWVDNDACTEKEQREEEYIDYSCDDVLGCDGITTQTRWVDTGATRNKADGTVCDDGQWCTTIDQCTSGVCGGSPRSCSDGFSCSTDSCNEALDQCVNNEGSCSVCGQGWIPSQGCLCGGTLYNNGYCCDGSYSDASCSTNDDIIIDNTDWNNVSWQGSWATSTFYPGFYGFNYSYEHGADNWFLWNTSLAAGGYKVYIWYVDHSDRPADTVYSISSYYGSKDYVIDQRSNGGQWILLDQAYFDGESSVRLTNPYDTPEGACADAVRFERISCLSGDINCDGNINLADLGLITDSYEQASSHDLSGDGFFRLIDLTLFGRQWN